MEATTPTISPLAQNIKDAREAKGLTQLALAHKIGYNGPDAGASICRLESGQQEPRMGTIRKIADALGVSVAHLVRVRTK